MNGKTIFIIIAIIIAVGIIVSVVDEEKNENPELDILCLTIKDGQEKIVFRKTNPPSTADKVFHELGEEEEEDDDLLTLLIEDEEEEEEDDGPKTTFELVYIKVGGDEDYFGLVPEETKQLTNTSWNVKFKNKKKNNESTETTVNACTVKQLMSTR
jgi:hypothetical protein